MPFSYLEIKDFYKKNKELGMKNKGFALPDTNAATVVTHNALQIMEVLVLIKTYWKAHFKINSAKIVNNNIFCHLSNFPWKIGYSSYFRQYYIEPRFHAGGFFLSFWIRE